MLAELAEFTQVCREDRPLARALYEESLTLARALGDTRGTAIALVHLGDLAMEQGDLRAAQTYSTEGTALSRQLGDMEVLAWGLNTLGVVALGEGDAARAFALCEESLAFSQEWGSATHVAIRRYWLARAALLAGDTTRAGALFEENVAASREAGVEQIEANSLQGLGDVRLREQRLPEAYALHAQAVPGLQATSWRYALAYSLESFARLALLHTRWERAARLFGAAEALREVIRTGLLPVERDERDRDLQAVESALGADAFSAAWDAGRALTLDEALAEALSKQSAA